jgi:hypothetical protein
MTDRADFRRFIEASRPAGCDTPFHVLVQALRGTAAWGALEELTRGRPGATKGHPVHPDRSTETGQFAKPINRDPVTVNGAPAVLPPDVIGVIPSAVPPQPPPRQRSPPPSSSSALLQGSSHYDVPGLPRERSPAPTGD